MKKWLVALAAALMLPFTTFAYTHLVITWQDESTSSVALSELSDISFSGNNVIFTYAGGDTKSYDYAEIGKLTFSNADGISVATTDGNLSVTPNPTSGICQVRGLGTESAVCTVYTLSGRLVRQLVVSDRDAIDLTSLSKGLYVMIIDGQSFKIEKL